MQIAELKEERDKPYREALLCARVGEHDFYPIARHFEGEVRAAYAEGKEVSEDWLLERVAGKTSPLPPVLLRPQKSRRLPLSSFGNYSP